MNRSHTIGRWFFGAFSVVIGGFLSLDLFGRSQQGDVWVSHFAEIAVAVFCFVAGYMSFARPNGFRAISAVVAIDAILSGLVGIFWKASPVLGAVSAAIGFVFLVRLFLPVVRCEKRVASA